MAADGKKGILDEFAEFLAAKQQADKDAEDPEVFLSTTDKDGNRHELTINASKAGKWIFEKFGIGEDPDAAAGGDDGDDDDKSKGKKPAGVPNLFGRKAG